MLILMMVIIIIIIIIIISGLEIYATGKCDM